MLAGTRSHRSGPSLSPASLLDLPEGTRLVLPSPNGSSISHVLMAAPALVLVGCLRNAAAVAERVAAQVSSLPTAGAAGAAGVAGTAGARVAVVPAGERWADGSLRVAYEDHVGAGAVIARLARRLPGLELSPEARVAAAAFDQREDLSHTPSGRELVERGFAEDVAIASEVDVSGVVPVLRDGSFTPA